MKVGSFWISATFFWSKIYLIDFKISHILFCSLIKKIFFHCRDIINCQGAYDEQQSRKMEEET